MHDPRVQLDPPLAQVPWSSDFAPRSLETLFVFLRDGQPILLRPIHAESLLLGWGAGAQPGAIVVEAAARYGLHPIVVHSTSWRTLDERLVLTYLAVVEAPEHPGPHLIEVPVLRTDLARGERLAAPAHIDLDAVIEHAFRHLRWLLDDDAIVREALPDWPSALESCRPEPFRAFAPDVGTFMSEIRSGSPRDDNVVDRFIDACAADDRIVAAFLTGSYATDTADAYSDLDLGVITTDATFADVLADRRALVGQLGEPLFLDHFGRAWNVFFILADGTEGEIFFGHEGALDEIDVGPFGALLDERGILAGAEFRFSPPDPDAQLERLRQIVNWFWHELSHFIAAIGRGDLWWAYGQLEALRGHCVNLMRIQHGAEAQDEPYEKLAKTIPLSDLAPLRTTFCPMERDAMLDAAREIVRFFRERAPGVAEADGAEYPSALAQLMSDRLDALSAR